MSSSAASRVTCARKYFFLPPYRASTRTPSRTVAGGRTLVLRHAARADAVVEAHLERAVARGRADERRGVPAAASDPGSAPRPRAPTAGANDAAARRPRAAPVVVEPRPPRPPDAAAAWRRRCPPPRTWIRRWTYGSVAAFVRRVVHARRARRTRGKGAARVVQRLDARASPRRRQTPRRHAVSRGRWKPPPHPRKRTTSAAPSSAEPSGGAARSGAALAAARPERPPLAAYPACSRPPAAPSPGMRAEAVPPRPSTNGRLAVAPRCGRSRARLRRGSRRRGRALAAAPAGAASGRGERADLLERERLAVGRPSKARPARRAPRARARAATGPRCAARPRRSRSRRPRPWTQRASAERYRRERRAREPQRQSALLDSLEVSNQTRGSAAVAEPFSSEDVLPR